MKEKKKLSDMTFKDFLRCAKDKGENTEGFERGVREVFRNEGFSDSQVDKMKMQKVWDLTKQIYQQYAKRLAFIAESRIGQFEEAGDKIGLEDLRMIFTDLKKKLEKAEEELMKD